MKKIFILTFAALTICACENGKQKAFEKINAEIAAGNFDIADSLIDIYIAENNLNDDEIYNLNWQKDLMHRKKLDFRQNREGVVKYISKYYPEVDDTMLEHWENTKALETMIINGEKKYFRNAARNLFRIDKDAGKRKIEVDGESIDELELLLEKYLPEVISQAKESPTRQSLPKKMKITYTLTVPANTVPANETLRCWLPYPRTDSRRQTDIELLDINVSDYIISPDEYLHKSMYIEQAAKENEPVIFKYSFTMSTIAEWFDLKPENIKPYDKESELYKKYTAERSTHVIFSDLIKEYSAKIVENETNPLLVSNRILQYIKDNYPWASALEYSTMANIPEYVITNNHGDCGMVGLLYITLCRYNGIPARWQSGFMLHPGDVNLHDWAETYFEGIGWVPVDPSLIRHSFADSDVNAFYSNGIDAYRWIVNDDYSQEFYPAKKYPRSETVDFQRGEVEWNGGNLYFNKWNWDIDVEYLN
ncbi:MAG: transglutaminase domain-containing protein [Prevotellaceae bacterium]|nr:transglutaminase domain-containing protein [Prevotellaceae bacterium]